MEFIVCYISCSSVSGRQSWRMGLGKSRNHGNCVDPGSRNQWTHRWSFQGVTIRTEHPELSSALVFRWPGASSKWSTFRSVEVRLSWQIAISGLLARFESTSSMEDQSSIIKEATSTGNHLNGQQTLAVFPGGAVVENLPDNARDTWDVSSIPGRGASPGGGTGNPLQYYCLENSTDKGAWWFTVHGVEKSQTRQHGTTASFGQASI